MRLLDNGVKVGLGTDVSGGSSPSMLEVLRAALASSSAINADATNRLTYQEAFRLLTLGGAKVLNMDHEVGSLEGGKFFDALLIDMKTTSNDTFYLEDVALHLAG
jgi:guanine deaminase